MASFLTTPMAQDALGAAVNLATPEQKCAINAAWIDRRDLLRTVTALLEVYPDTAPADLLILILGQEQWALFQKQFYARVILEPALRGRVLDIGCGPALPPFLRDLPRMTG